MLITRYLSPEQLSEITGMTLPALSTMRSAGKGPPFYKFGAKVRYKAEDIERWMDAQRHEPFDPARNVPSALSLRGTRPKISKGHRLGGHKTKTQD